MVCLVRMPPNHLQSSPTLSTYTLVSLRCTLRNLAQPCHSSSACPPTISNHLQLHPPTLRCHSDAHCITSHNHTTPVARLNSDQCLISLDVVPMSRAATYLSFSPYATFA